MTCECGTEAGNGRPSEARNRKLLKQRRGRFLYDAKRVSFILRRCRFIARARSYEVALIMDYLRIKEPLLATPPKSGRNSYMNTFDWALVDHGSVHGKNIRRSVVSWTLTETPKDESFCDVYQPQRQLLL